MLQRCSVIGLISLTKSCILEKASCRGVDKSVQKSHFLFKFVLFSTSCLFTLGGTLQKTVTLQTSIQIITMCHMETQHVCMLSQTDAHQ